VERQLEQALESQQASEQQRQDAEQKFYELEARLTEVGAQSFCISSWSLWEYVDP